MRKAVWMLGVLALTAGMAAAQDKAALEKTLIANEHKINEAVAKADRAGFTALTASDGLSADGNGFMKIGDFTPIMDQAKIQTWKISDEKVQWVDANTAIVAYVWTGSGTFQGQRVPPKTYASTVWTKKGDKWIAVYHQESEAAKPAPAKPAVKK
ncbi:MAG TPA: nuclear transport factor 2 family protein [Vicinamibacterales bacterium]|jgi:hypothetical protein|nr:nuclear transport factor 2 family protein [Vicinamibacterales bacterium]